MSDEKVCFRSNINAAGRRRRRNISNALAVGGVAAMTALHLWYGVRGSSTSLLVRVAATFPFLVGALLVHLEVTRNTCVVLAARGAKEKDQSGQDGKTHERVTAEDELRASRQVSYEIKRDSILLGAIASAAFAVWETYYL